MFNDDDLVGWIGRAKVYFNNQGTSLEVKVNLAQLCMEGLTIHIFKSLLDEQKCLTWDEFKSELLEHYGSMVKVMFWSIWLQSNKKGAWRSMPRIRASHNSGTTIAQ